MSRTAPSSPLPLRYWQRRDDKPTLAYHYHAGGSPGIIFLPGFLSDMTGHKALAILDYCRQHGQSSLLFDYRGHGQSDGDTACATISDWLDDCLELIDHCTTGQQILVGSSMGGWLMLQSAIKRPDRIAGLIGLAIATDFTQRLTLPSLSPAERQTLSTQGHVTITGGDNGEYRYLISKALIEDGQKHLLLDKPIPINCPVTLLHGDQDRSVPWSIAQLTLDNLTSDQAILTLIKGGDHRLSDANGLHHLYRALDDMIDRVNKARLG